MIISVRFCLSYDPLKWDFMAFKMNIISIRKYIADTDVVNDVTFLYRSVIPCVVLRLFMTRCYLLNNSHVVINPVLVLRQLCPKKQCLMVNN